MMGPIGFSETSVRYYHSVLSKIIIKKKQAQISFTMQQKPAVTHYSGSLPMKATRLMDMIKMAMEYVPASQYDVTRRMLLADSQHKATKCPVLHLNISTTHHAQLIIIKTAMGNYAHVFFFPQYTLKSSGL